MKACNGLFLCSYLLTLSATYVTGQNGASNHASPVEPFIYNWCQTSLPVDTRGIEQRELYESGIQEYISYKKTNPTPQNVITIPVVVHILYNTPSENVSDNRVFSQIIALNNDFGRASPDTGNTPAPFALVAANTGIQFCLARQDPNGFPTSGIERRQTSLTELFSNAQIKFFSGGGLDQWDPTRYFNIWVCDMGVGTGHGEFPLASTTNTYGATVDYQVFGSNHTIYGTFPGLLGDWGRTAVHEVGHCFNLRHIWGDDNNSCSGTDYCSDTPNQAGPTYMFPSFPQYDSCTSTGDGIMFCNYMDYTYHAARNLFTQEQSLRMNAVLSLLPYNALANSNACQSPAIFYDDAAIWKVNYPNGYVDAPLQPKVLLLNLGIDTLYGCKIYYQVDAGPANVFSWSGILASCDTVTVTLDSIWPLSGTHTFTAFTNLPNGSQDARPSNDTASLSFNVKNNQGTQSTAAEFYPTLFDESLTINISGTYTVTIFNAIGQRVYNEVIYAPSSINLENLSKGIYIIRLDDQYFHKVVKY